MHKTAIVRKNPSVPMRWLDQKGLLVGRMLDYGCGRGKDACTYGMATYDPHYQPVMPAGLFDTITCNYVLNVIESHEERKLVLLRMWFRLQTGGRAYITVRNDRKALNGCTSKGTWQGLVRLNLPVVRHCASYIIYELRQDAFDSFLEDGRVE